MVAVLLGNVALAMFCGRVFGVLGTSLLLLLVADVRAAQRGVVHPPTHHSPLLLACPSWPPLRCGSCAQCATIGLRVTQTLVKYGLHLWDLRSDNNNAEARTTVAFLVDFLFDTVQLVVTLAHYMHIWSRNGSVATLACGCLACGCHRHTLALLRRFTLKLIDAVLFLNTRSVFSSLREKIRSYTAFFRAAEHINGYVSPCSMRCTWGGRVIGC
jgi:hypothetical protein